MIAFHINVFMQNLTNEWQKRKEKKQEITDGWVPIWTNPSEEGLQQANSPLVTFSFTDFCKTQTCTNTLYFNATEKNGHIRKYVQKSLSNRFELKLDLKGCKENTFGFGCQLSVVLEVFTWLKCTGARHHHDKQMNTNVHLEKGCSHIRCKIQCNV